MEMIRHQIGNLTAKAYVVEALNEPPRICVMVSHSHPPAQKPSETAQILAASYVLEPGCGPEDMRQGLTPEWLAGFLSGIQTASALNLGKFQKQSHTPPYTQREPHRGLMGWIAQMAGPSLRALGLAPVLSSLPNSSDCVATPLDNRKEAIQQ